MSNPKRIPVTLYHDTFVCWIEAAVTKHGISLELWDEDEGYPEMFADLIRLPGSGRPNTGCVDVNNFPWAIRVIEDYGLGKPTGMVRESNWCRYPEYEFDLDKLAEYAYEAEEE